MDWNQFLSLSSNDLMGRVQNEPRSLIDLIIQSLGSIQNGTSQEPSDILPDSLSLDLIEVMNPLPFSGECSCQNCQEMKKPCIKQLEPKWKKHGQTATWPTAAFHLKIKSEKMRNKITLLKSGAALPTDKKIALKEVGKVVFRFLRSYFT